MEGTLAIAKNYEFLETCLNEYESLTTTTNVESIVHSEKVRSCLHVTKPEEN